MYVSEREGERERERERERDGQTTFKTVRKNNSTSKSEVCFIDYAQYQAKKEQQSITVQYN